MPKILVVEDDVIVRMDIRQTLHRLGHTVVGEASDGETALAMAEELRPDLVLMDIGLGGVMNGVEAAIAIREQVRTPVVFLTGSSDPATLDKAKKALAYGYILKPFEPKTVRTVVELALYRHKQDSGVTRERNKLFQLASVGKAEDGLFVSHNRRMIRLNFTDIYYVEALRDYVGIFVRDRRYVAYSTLKNLAVLLPANDFVRVHRSFIVRVDKIAAMEPPNIILDDERGIIPIGTKYYSQVMEQLPFL